MKIKSSDYIASKLEESILKGNFKNGERLSEMAISSQFGVSRTPVREALQKLTQTGLVEQIPSRGVFVRQPGPVELMELFELMGELEASCGRFAAKRISDKALEELIEASLQCKKALEENQTDTYYYANKIFHKIIYRESGNSFLEQETNRLHQRLKPFRRLQLQVRGRMLQSMSEHDQIIEALSNGDAEKAAECLREHVVIQGDKFRQLLATLQKVQQQ